MLHEELIGKAVSKVGVLVLFFARNVRNHRVKKNATINSHLHCLHLFLSDEIQAFVRFHVLRF